MISEKKKTLYSWIILALMAVLIVSGLINTILTLFSRFFALSPVVQIIHLILLMIGLVVEFAFFFKIYFVTPDLIKWANITFGYIIFLYIEGFVLEMLRITATISVSLPGLSFWLSILPEMLVSASTIRLILFVIVWITFVNHLKGAQEENLMDFS